MHVLFVGLVDRRPAFSCAVCGHIGVPRSRSLLKPIFKGSKSNGSRYGILFSLLCVYVGWLALSQYWVHWHGDWDALAIWNLHARLLYRSGGQWLQTFSRHIYDGHQDYPLLLPSLVASGWTLHGAESTAIPGILSFVFTFLVVAL